MALPILDGNQTAATLSTIIIGGAHIPAHTVVSLGSQAISDISNAVSSVQVSGTVTASLADQIYYSGTPVFVAAYVDSPGGSVIPVSQDANAGMPISGTVTVGNSVTIGSLPTLTPQLPRVTFIDGSGTVTTANTAVTVFASSSTRSYLLVQVTTGSAFVNVGATATTVNGISLTAGQGYAWETTIPQGIVSLISTTTSSRYVAKQA